MTAFGFQKGLLKLGEGAWAYIQPDGSWGLNNAGLVTDTKESKPPKIFPPALMPITVILNESC